MNTPKNPYATPDFHADEEAFETIWAHEISMVNQVNVVGILQIVLGVMETLVGSLLMFFAVALVYAREEFEADEVYLMYGLQAGYGILGLTVIVFAIMRIVSGIGAFSFRARKIMMISLIGGMASSLTCYCAPFSMGLGIYGLIVMYQPGVIKAYRLGAKGVTGAEIKQRLAMALEYGHAPSMPTEGPSQ